MPAIPTADPLDDEDLAAAANRAERQRQCTQMLLVVMISYGVDTLLLLGLAYAGAIDSLVAWVFAATGAVACGFFSLLLRLGFSERLSDPFLVVPQMLVHSAIHVGFMYWVPGVGVLFLTMLLVI